MKRLDYFVTGATGIIGQALVRKLNSEGKSILALVRDVDRAKAMFAGVDIDYVVGDITDFSVDQYDFDYVVHAAANTSSKDFVQKPVDIINSSVDGMRHILEVVKDKNIRSFVYLSSMEVYGTPETDDKIYEYSASNLNTMSARSSYPESKRMCENLCTAYCAQYNMPTKVVRLTQTFGKGVKYNDSRVFAEFARCAIEKKDIVLHTKGETKRSYLSVDDAVEAILAVLYKGQNGEVYNAANEDTYCSIFEMAQLVRELLGNNEIQVRIEDENVERGYAPTLHMNLDTTKLRNLGWRPKYDLKYMYKEMVNCWHNFN